MQTSQRCPVTGTLPVHLHRDKQSQRELIQKVLTAPYGEYPDDKEGHLKALTEKVKPGLCAVESDEWKPFTATVDSGASEHVVPPNVVDHIKLDDGVKKGCEYEVADGGTIENLGERRCLVANDHSHSVNRIDLQVTDVHKPLLSVAKMVDAGQRVIFDPRGAYIEDTVTRERIPMERRGGIYEMRLWAKQYKPKNRPEDFHRQR